MRTVQLEHLRPGEILKEKQRRSIIYIPLGPVEWHNPANPYGVDAFLAHSTACMAAEKTGGVVFPTCYMGSDDPRPKEHLERLGFDKTDQYIVGMDFPNNLLKSFYFPVDLVSLVIKEHVRICIKHEYKLIVLLSAHGAATQNQLIGNICQKFTNESGSVVINGFTKAFESVEAHDLGASIVGHANISETSMMCYLNSKDVDLKELPRDRNEKLRYQDYGIIDRSVLLGGEPGDGFVKNDPRDSNSELGEELIRDMVTGVINAVCSEYDKISSAPGTV